MTALVGTQIAMYSQARLAEDDVPAVDEVLARLLEDCLYSSNPDQRMTASMLIKATPYRAPVAQALLAEVRADLSRRAGTLTPTALRTLTNLGADLHRPLINHILRHPHSSPSARHSAAWATPHGVGQQPVPTAGHADVLQPACTIRMRNIH